MPLNNPTIGNESQFNPTGPIDSGKYSYPGYTFNILPDVIYLNPSGQGIITSQFTPTTPIDGNQYTYPSYTFNLQVEKLQLFNPTNQNNTLIRPAGEYPVTANLIKKQFAPSTTPAQDTFDLRIEKLIGKNPTNPDNILSKPPKILPSSIISQFAPSNTAGLDTFNLVVESLATKNPTNPDNDLLYFFKKDLIDKQYPFGAGTSKSIAPTTTFDLIAEKLLLNNPTNPDNTLLKPIGDSAVTFSTITDQFAGKEGLTGQQMLNEALGFVGNISAIKNFSKKSSFLSIVDAFGKLDKNVSHPSYIQQDGFNFLKRLKNQPKWLKNLKPSTPTSEYATLQLSQLHPLMDATYIDFRTRRRTTFLQSLFDADLPEDENANQRDSKIKITAVFASDSYKAAQEKIIGLYSEYNVERTYGVSQAATKDITVDITNPNTYRFSDRITRIDAQQTTYDSVYSTAGDGETDSITNKTPEYKDFIKFFFTGPNVLTTGGKDDVMVFRSIITSLSDTFNPNWTPQQMVGRADPNYHYTGYSRDLSVDFTVFANDRSELKAIWRKLNMLAGYTTPSYDQIAMKGPWMRITIGDLFIQQPAIINSLSYTLHDSDTTWEINIEQDNQDTVQEVPKKVSVSLGLNLITDQLPQKGGNFYSLMDKWEA